MRAGRFLARASFTMLTAPIVMAAGIGCATSPAKRLEVHYVQVESCRTWKDFDDDGSVNVNPDPLIVFRITSITNKSAPGTAAATFDLTNVYYQGLTRQPPEATGIQSFVIFSDTSNPGATKIPSGGGLFPIQLFDETIDDQTFPQEAFFLLYNTASQTDQSVFMIREASAPQFQQFCGRSLLSGL